MELYVFLGIFAAVGLGIFVIYRIVRGKLRRFSRQVFGNDDLLDALSQLETEAEETPRSLNACDSLLLPRILKDFPDFDMTMAKTYLREYLQKQFSAQQDLRIHSLAAARYLPSAAQKTIIFQAAVSWLEEGRRSQKRFDIHYTHLISTSDPTVAANCPNCGGALGFGQNQCPYCGSRVVGVLKNTWTFTQILES